MEMSLKKVKIKIIMLQLIIKDYKVYRYRYLMIGLELIRRCTMCSKKRLWLYECRCFIKRRQCLSCMV